MMAEIQTTPSVLAISPAAGPGQAAQAGPAAAGSDVFANVLSGRMAAVAQGDAPAKGAGLAAFAGNGRLLGIPGLLLADKATPASEAAAGLDPALLAAFAGAQPTDPALLAMLAAGSGMPMPAVVPGAADVAADGKELPLAPLGDAGRRALPGSNPSRVLNEGLAAERAGVDEATTREPAKGVQSGPAGVQAQLELKALEAPLKAANVQVGGEALAATGQAVARSDELALAGVVQHKGASDGASQVVLNVRTPLQAANWAADFSQKVVWLAGRESQSAQMILNPPQLGAVEVRLTVSGTEAGAQFFSPHQGVREAIEAAIPRLRDLMAEAGLSLGQASVSPESFRHASGQGEPQGRGAGSADGENAEVVRVVNAATAQRVMGQGLVDLYV